MSSQGGYSNLVVNSALSFVVSAVRIGRRIDAEVLVVRHHTVRDDLIVSLAVVLDIDAFHGGSLNLLENISDLLSSHSYATPTPPASGVCLICPTSKNNTK